MNPIVYFKNLKWIDKAYDEVEEGHTFKRKNPLTFKQIFFRDWMSILTNFVSLCLIIIILIHALVS